MRIDPNDPLLQELDAIGRDLRSQQYPGRIALDLAAARRRKWRRRLAAWGSVAAAAAVLIAALVIAPQNQPRDDQQIVVEDVERDSRRRLPRIPSVKTTVAHKDISVSMPSMAFGFKLPQTPKRRIEDEQEQKERSDRRIDPGTPAADRFGGQQANHRRPIA